jgi:hypothetical protein
VKYTFFSAAHGTFSTIDYILGHKASLNKYKKTKITSFILSDHNGIKLEISSKGKYNKYINTWTMTNILLNDQWFTEEIRKFLESNDNENTTYQKVWDTAKCLVRGKFTVMSIYIKKI